MKIIKSDTCVNVNKCVNYVDKQGISPKKMTVIPFIPLKEDTKQICKNFASENRGG